MVDQKETAVVHVTSRQVKSEENTGEDVMTLPGVTTISVKRVERLSLAVDSCGSHSVRPQ